MSKKDQIKLLETGIKSRTNNLCALIRFANTDDDDFKKDFEVIKHLAVKIEADKQDLFRLLILS